MYCWIGPGCLGVIPGDLPNVGISVVNCCTDTCVRIWYSTSDTCLPIWYNHYMFDVFWRAVAFWIWLYFQNNLIMVSSVLQSCLFRFSVVTCSLLACTYLSVDIFFVRPKISSSAFQST